MSFWLSVPFAFELFAFCLKTCKGGVTRLAGVALMAKSSKAKHVCFKTLYIS